eukprot:TRINITY_DN3112_c0_g2_i11.p1 TRINITY_DN3112_c0_g2~~TRINITY_DN3112_c0_g2_i11.p1  ORF type:complete len:708 (+),score=168.88 TRINITY_DN3112_c0_g2_i11:68-2191(+)
MLFLSVSQANTMAKQISRNLWLLESKSMAYCIGYQNDKFLVNTYFGKKLKASCDYPEPRSYSNWAHNDLANRIPEEFPGHGDQKYHEPCLKVTFKDGVRDTDFRLMEAQVSTNGLKFFMKDAVYPLVLVLEYEVMHDLDLISRRISVKNEGQEDVLIERVLSAQWNFHSGKGDRLSYVYGKWLDEFNLRRDPLQPGVKILESRRLMTSHQGSPWFVYDKGNATEDAGNVWFSALSWSGNWKIIAEVTEFEHTKVSIGINDWDFAWKLRGGDTFEAPFCIGGFSENGFGGASRIMHDFAREKVLPRGKEVRKILYNSWEATFFDVDEKSQGDLAEEAAALGIELFVVDDGWFHGRNTDNAGLGDWWPDAKKFPNGLSPLVKRVKELGMDFGIWVEPEMVNPNSELYRSHPDWVYHFPTRPRREHRNQLILNLGREDVQNYLLNILDKLLSENDISFIKWDMNRSISEAGWQDSPHDEARELWVRHTTGLYKVWGTLKQKHPKVLWQSCSGGGGRTDFGIMAIADQVWTSDNTDAPARVQIQEGFSQIYPAIAMEAWVTDASHGLVPLSFRFHVSMAGNLGIGSHLLKWNQEEKNLAKEQIQLYKSIRHIIHLGDQYRIGFASDEGITGVQYVSKDKEESVLFLFRVWISRTIYPSVVLLKGLDPDSFYTVEGETGIRSGLGWANVGITVDIKNLQSSVRKIKKIQRSE